jgi:hypothetical protein
MTRREICSAEGRLGTEVRSASTGMDLTDRQEAPRAPSAGKVPLLVRYRVNVSISLFTQLQLWYLH